MKAQARLKPARLPRPHFSDYERNRLKHIHIRDPRTLVERFSHYGFADHHVRSLSASLVCEAAVAAGVGKPVCRRTRTGPFAAARGTGTASARFNRAYARRGLGAARS